LKAAIEQGAVMIVDSCKKGKVFPDSFSKTIPIWACVFNRAIAKYKKEFDTELHLPMWIPQQEKSQIEEKLDLWVSNLMVCK
jgi:tRNA A64-2'-O-ribosylphosphate transferase